MFPTCPLSLMPRWPEEELAPLFPRLIKLCCVTLFLPPLLMTVNDTALRENMALMNPDEQLCLKEELSDIF